MPPYKSNLCGISHFCIQIYGPFVGCSFAKLPLLEGQSTFVYTAYIGLFGKNTLIMALKVGFGERFLFWCRFMYKYKAKTSKDLIGLLRVKNKTSRLQSI